MMFCFSACFLSCNNYDYLEFIDKVDVKEREATFALFKANSIIGNPNFYVFQLDINSKPEELKYKTSNSKNWEQKEYNKIYNQVILENYEEDGRFITKPTIKLFNSRFIVMERGGLYFALYDLELHKEVFNDCCPFSKWGSQKIWAENGTNYKGAIPEDENSDYGIWIKKNIHLPILEYIEKNE